MQVFAADRTDRPCTRPTLVQRLDYSGTLTPLLSGIVGAGNRWPALVPKLNALVVATYFAEYELVAHSDRVFNLAMPPRHYESEYAFDLQDTETAIERVNALIKRDKIPVNFVTEVRFVAGDDTWLSPAYGRDSCQLGTYIGAMPQWRPYFEGVEAIAMDMSARPHWVKSFFAERDALRELYPRFDDFLAARDRLDPERVFENDFTRRILG
jgi:L-gulonolactone oxidase